MAHFDDRVRIVLLEYFASIKSQEAAENGEQGSFEMDGSWAGEEEVAPDLGSNATEIPGTYPHTHGGEVFETANEPPGRVQGSIEKDTHTVSNQRRRHQYQISCARRYAIIEVARKLKFDNIREYREAVERKFELRARTGLRTKHAEYARAAEASIARECIERLEPSEKIVVDGDIDYLIGIILNEPNWHGRVGSPTWRASLDVENRLERTPALDDWHDRMISRVRQRLSDSIWDAVEQAEEDQTLGAVLDIDDPARALSNASEGKGTMTLPEGADSLEMLLQDPNHSL